jgi:hypothetical protein
MEERSAKQGRGQSMNNQEIYDKYNNFKSAYKLQDDGLFNKLMNLAREDSIKGLFKDLEGIIKMGKDTGEPIDYISKEDLDELKEKYGTK